MPSYDRSPPLARINPIRPVSSHSHKISALFSLFDESGIDTPLHVAIGTVPGEFGNDVMDWTTFDLSGITTPPPDNGDSLNLFSFRRVRILLCTPSQFSRLGNPSVHCVLWCVLFEWSVCHIQWNLSNPDTLGTEESVLISEVSWFQGLKITQTWYLGQQKVSCLSRCPHFRASRLEGFQCIF